MNNQKLVHEYAHQTKTQGKGSHLFYEGPTLYSYGYHFPICHIARGANGSDFLFWNDRRHSNTTNKHQALAARGTRHLTRIDIPAGYMDSVIYAGEDSTFAQLAQAWRTGAQRLIKEMGTTGQAYAKRLNAFDALRAIETNVIYFVRDFLGLSPDNPPANFAWFPVIRVVMDEYRATQYQADQATRDKRSASALAAADARSENQQRRWRERYGKSTPEQIADWIAGTRATVNPGEYDILRLLPGDVVETSQGIKMSRDEAKAIYFSLIRQELKPGDHVLNRYPVISVNGTVKIGCHIFETEYLINFGKTL